MKEREVAKAILEIFNKMDNCGDCPFYTPCKFDIGGKSEASLCHFLEADDEDRQKELEDYTDNI